MTPSRRQFVTHVAKVFDLCALVISFFLATVVLYSPTKVLTLAGLMDLRIKLGNCLLFVLLLITWHCLFIVCGLYVSKRLTRLRVQVFEVVKATLLAVGFLFCVGQLFHAYIINPTFVLVFWAFCAGFMCCGRLATYSLLLFLRRRGKNSRFMLIVGTNDRAIEFARQIASHPEFGYNIVGFVDDDWSGISKFEATGYSRCCTFSDLADFFRHNVVDEAAIYLPLRSYYEHAAQLISLCEQHGIGIRLDSQIFNFRVSPGVERLDASFQASATDSADVWPGLAKRILDCVVSSVLLVLSAPLFVVVAILIKWTSPGQVFFRQTRVGLNKRQFKIFKFRTMIANAEQLQDDLLPMNEMSGPVFKIKHDPRVTPLGRALRRTSIDELPQLLNVLKGDMSLVGPRPMSLRDYQLFDQDWQRRRFSVKPGITCLWQIKGRNSIPFEEWMQLDMQYIDKWSLWLDVKILLQTLPAVLRGTGAA